MSIPTSFICNKCNHIFEVLKNSIKDDFPDTPCPECKSPDTRRYYGDYKVTTDTSMCKDSKSFIKRKKPKLGRYRNIK